jgi:hypothetical protein
MSCTCSRVSRGFLLHLFFLLWLIDALTAANARIVALEAVFNASREAWEGANAAKIAAEKATKSAETKAKKAKKALADADQKRVRREQMIAKRPNKISVLVGGKCRVVSFFSTCSCFHLLIIACFLLPFSSMMQQRKLEYI